MKTKLMKYAVAASTLGLIALPFATHAAADPVIVNAAGDAAGLMRDNVVGILTSAAYLGVVIGVVALFFGIRWALKKIFGRGR